ncbi:MAG: hypothetical protein Q9222_004693 [Ikaeria aurantiellina]
MPTSLTPFPTPQTLLYLRSLTLRPLPFQTPMIHHLQIRTKRKSANRPQTIPVRLLQDIPGYGRKAGKGTIIPIPPGRMRNIYHPAGKADYVTAAQLRSLNPKDGQQERDFSFGLSSSASSSSSSSANTIIQPSENIRAKLLTPKRTREVIDTLLPPDLIFYRPPITTSEPDTSPAEPLGNSINAIGGAAAASPPPPPPTPQKATRIFGSVTTSDIADAIKAVLAADEEGKRVVLGSEDVVITDTVDEERGVSVRAQEMGT